MIIQYAIPYFNANLANQTGNNLDELNPKQGKSSKFGAYY